MEMEKKRVLVVGGSGYLGQHLLQALSSKSDQPFHLAFTFHRTPPPQGKTPNSLSPVLAFRVDLATGEGFESVFQSFGQPDVVINCAALSVPRECERDPAYAMSVNVPSSLVGWLSSFANRNTFLIHLSTDQVYEGVKSFYKEDDETVPVNMYGKTKVASEQFIRTNYHNFAILRSSIIYGPECVTPVSKSLPLQWIDNMLSRGHEVDFFYDEFRCPIYVKDLVNIILILINKWVADEKTMRLVLNVGGSERVSRLQMAEKVAEIRGHDCSLIRSVSSSSVDRGVNSPADISMDISRLTQELGIAPISFDEGVRLTFQTTDVQI